jgi:hypothetical protein
MFNCPFQQFVAEAGAHLFPIIRDGLESFVTAFAAVKRDGTGSLFA